MAPVVIRRHLTAKVRVQSLASPCWIRGGQRDTGTGSFFRITSVFSVIILSTGAPCSFNHSFIHSFFHLTPTVYMQYKHLWWSVNNTLKKLET